jgi:putative salt-induced outer membrane protein YdiY
MRPVMMSLAFLGVVIAAESAHAQIVNTQPLLQKIVEDGVSGEIRASFEWRTGNVELLKLAAGSLFVFRRCDHAVVWSSELEIGENAGASYVFKAFSHLRYQYQASDLVTWEVFGQIAHDRFKRLTLRGLVGTGPRWSLLATEGAQIALGTAYMFEHEEYSVDDALADSGTSTDHHRLSTYLNGRFALDERIGFIATVFYQPRFDAWADDWRLLAEVQLAITIAQKLALTIAFSAAYDDETPDDVDGLDTTTLVGISWTF